MFPFSRSSAESSHPCETGKSLSEVFLDSSSRTRNALPEQYRTQFDELRSGIFAFCHEFAIPVDTLRSKEEFGKQLASKNIPQERMAQAVSLFEQLEHLIVQGEPFREKQSEAMEYADRLYHLSEQYADQFHLLKEVGILNEYNAIVGIDGHEYPIPTLEQIAQRLYERREVLSIKQDQGFTKLLLVPFGMGLDELIESLGRFLRHYQQNHQDFGLDSGQPFRHAWSNHFQGIDIGNSPKLIYHPMFFYQYGHGGETKARILKRQEDTTDVFAGWTVHLFQPSDPLDPHSLGFVPIPQIGQEKTYGVEFSRPDIKTSKSPKDYLSLLQKAQDNPTSPYRGESGMTPEDWILAFMTHFQETGEVLDRNCHLSDCKAYLIGAFFPSQEDFGLVPYVCWSDTYAQVTLDGNEPRNRGIIGVRTSVLL